jgi:CubicO group peptidase (beta-lactamase class C family)
MFEVGSIAKQFAAVAILQLRDAGKLSLDDAITKWLPFVGTSGSRVTLRHLLTHTSGVNGFGEESEWEIRMFLPRFPRDSAERLVKLEPFRFPPGEAQAYSNSGFWLLGRVVEQASGMKYEDYVAKQIFEPLGMKRSMYCNSSANVARRAHGYHMVAGTIQRAPLVNYAWVFAPGAICSTASDMVTWLQALHGGKVLSPKSYAEMTTQAKLNDGTALHYGMGIDVGEDYRGLKYIGHGGTAPGFRADARWYPDGQLAIVVLMNTSPSTLVPAGVSDALAREVLPWKRKEMKFYTGDPAPFVGKYQVVTGGNVGPVTIEVSASPTGLAFSANGSRPEALPWAGELTFYANEFTTLTFRRANGDTGPVIELRRDNTGNHAILKKQ